MFTEPRPILPPNLPAKALLPAAKLGLTAAVAGYTWRVVDWPALGDTLSRMKAAPLFTALALQGVATAIAATRWQVLLLDQGIRLPWRQSLQLTLSGMFFNLFFLGTIGGDTAKFVGLLPQARERKGALMISLFQDRLIGLGGLLVLLAAFVASQWPRVGNIPGASSASVALAAACVLFFGGISGLRACGPAGDRQSGWKLVVSRLAPGPGYGPALLLSLGIHVSVMTAGYLAAHAIGLALPWAAAGVVFGSTTLALSLPVTIAGLGVRETVLLLALGWFGTTDSQMAVALSFCLLGINLFWASLGGLALYWRAGRDQTPAENPP